MPRATATSPGFPTSPSSASSSSSHDASGASSSAGGGGGVARALADEGEGWVVVAVHDAASQKGELAILDAQVTREADADVAQLGIAH